MAKTGMTVGLINALTDSADPAVITEAVEGWLDDHPEATTTVEDGSITKAKLDSNLAGAIDDVGDLKTSIEDVPDVAATDETQSDLDLVDVNGYVVARFANGHFQTKYFNSEEASGIEYKFSGSDLLLGYGYNATHDAVVVMNQGRANNLFDFAALMLKLKGAPLADLETSDLTSVWATSSDMHSPFQFNAVNDADGYDASATSPGFVGGNHTLDQLGSDFKTAASKYVYFFADGRPVTSGYGKASHFEIRWANDVQAYNTVKEGGGGRVCLTEYHDMIFDGVRFTESVKLVALEDIDMRLWYGFQFPSWKSTYTDIRFIDAENRGVYTSGDYGSGNHLTAGMEAYGDAHKIIMTVDTVLDLGRREHVANLYPDGAFTSSTKGYFRIITTTGFTMEENEAYYLKGTYRFCPTVEGDGD